MHLDGFPNSRHSGENRGSALIKLRKSLDFPWQCLGGESVEQRSKPGMTEWLRLKIDKAPNKVYDKDSLSLS